MRVVIVRLPQAFCHRKMAAVQSTAAFGCAKRNAQGHGANEVGGVPIAFLRRESAAFSAWNAENKRKCNRHGDGKAAGVFPSAPPKIPYAEAYGIFTFSLFPILFYLVIRKIEYDHKTKAEMSAHIRFMSTFALKSNWSLFPSLNTRTSSLSISNTPAVSIPQYCTLEYG